MNLPIAYGNCRCQCHVVPGVMHYVACCKPEDGPADNLVSGLLAALETFEPSPTTSQTPIVDLDASQTPSESQDPAVLALRDHRDDEIDELQARILLLEAEILVLEVRPDFQYIAPDKPETWPEPSDQPIVCWTSATQRPIVTTSHVARAYSFFLSGTYYAWMPLDTPPKD